MVSIALKKQNLKTPWYLVPPRKRNDIMIKAFTNQALKLKYVTRDSYSANHLFCN